MRLDSNKVEESAVLAVRQRFVNINNVRAFISTNDKTPVIDGSIFVYDNQNSLKGTVPVQVKGKTYTNTTNKKSYPLPRKMLEQYTNLGGVLLFVVFINTSASEAVPEVYCSLLHHERCKSLLETRKGKKTINVPLRRLSNDNQTVLQILEIALKYSQNQTSLDLQLLKDLPTKYKLITMPEIFTPGRTTMLDSSRDDFAFSAVDESGKEHLLGPGILKFGPSFDEFPYPIQSGNITYRKALRTKNEDGHLRLILSRALAIDIDVLGESPTISITVSWNGNIPFSTHLKAIRFIGAMTEINEVKINHQPLKVGIPAPDFSENMRSRKEFFEKANACFKILGIDTESVLYEDLEAIDLRELADIAHALKTHDRSIFDTSEDGLYHHNIGNKYLELHLGEMRRQQGIWSIFFPNVVSLIYKPTDQNNETTTFPITLYDYYRAEELHCILNKNLNAVTEHYESIGLNESTCNLATDMVLKLLKCGDKYEEYARYYYNVASNLNDWITAKFDSSATTIINKIQIIKRQRALTDEEKDSLREILIPISEEPAGLDTHCAVYGLLEDANDFNFMWNKMTKEDQNRFKSYPIWTLFQETSSLNITSSNSNNRKYKFPRPLSEIELAIAEVWDEIALSTSESKK